MPYNNQYCASYRNQLFRLMRKTCISIVSLSKTVDLPEQNIRAALSGTGTDSDYELLAKFFNTTKEFLKKPISPNDKKNEISVGRRLENGQVTLNSLCSEYNLNKKGVRELEAHGLKVNRNERWAAVDEKDFRDAYDKIKDIPGVHTRPKKITKTERPLPIPSPFSPRGILFPENEICLDFKLTHEQLLQYKDRVECVEKNGFYYFNREQLKSVLT